VSKPKAKVKSKATKKVNSNVKPKTKPELKRPTPSYFCARCYLDSKQQTFASPEAVVVNGHKQLKRHNVVDILAKQLVPRIYDKTGGVAKIAVLLTLVGAAPKHPQNYYGERYWINTILAGDKGCGKTTLMEKAVNERVGGQLVSAQHSTGKSAVAIPELEGGSGTAILRIGPAALANDSVCGIDEFQLFNYESQDQFLDLQQSGCIYFNKLGIHQLIQAHTGFISTVNPVAGSWKNSRTVSLARLLYHIQSR
jgi:DNA replicative helicase MCM subunit Mcm2 (Cdc46/Mcm family)